VNSSKACRTNRAWADVLWTLSEEYLSSDRKKNFNDYVEWNIESYDKNSLIKFTVDEQILKKLIGSQIESRIGCRAAFIKQNPKSTISIEGKYCAIPYFPLELKFFV